MQEKGLSRRPVQEKARGVFAEKLTTWIRAHPECIRVVPENQVKPQGSLWQQEGRLRDEDVEKLLEEYTPLKESGIKFYKTVKQVMPRDAYDERGKEKYERITLYRFPVKSHFSEKRLPTGYFYKGGAARALLGRALGIDVQHPRDIDIVRFGEEPEKGMDHRIEEEFSPEEVGFGRGVEKINESRYFFTRDITLNEVVASDTEIIASAECVLDTVRRIIRMTPYERETYESEDGTSDQKILARMILFYVEHIERYDEAVLDPTTDKQFESTFISPFYMAVQLDKACQRGEGVANRYVNELKKRGQIPEYLEKIEEVARFSLVMMRDKDFYYRHAPSTQFEQEDEYIEEIYGDLEDGHAARREQVSQKSKARKK